MNALQEDHMIKRLKQGTGLVALLIGMNLIDPDYLIALMVWWGVFIKMD
jgi:hypothetical protein